MEPESIVATPVPVPEVTLLPEVNKEKGLSLSEAFKVAMIDTSRFTVEIKSAEMYAEAVQYAQKLALKIQEYTKEREGICPPLFQAHRNATSFFNRLINPLVERKEAIENGMTRYRIEQDRLRKLEQERKDAEERRRRELNDAHEAAMKEDGERLAAFLKAWDDAITYDADRTRAIERKKEEDARLEHAKVAHQEGNSQEKVDHILDTPTPLAPAPVVLSAVALATTPVLPPPAAATQITSAPPPPTPPPPPLTEVPPKGAPPSFVPDMKDVIKKTNWLFKITDKRKFLESVLAGVWAMDTITIEDGPMGPIGEKVRKKKAACVDEYKQYGIEVWPEADDKVRAPRASKGAA